MLEQVNIQVQQTNENVNIVSSEIKEEININVYETKEEVKIHVTEEVIKISINKVTSEKITKTSELINDGQDGNHPYITLEDLPDFDYTPEDSANKSTSIPNDQNSDLKYPTVKSVYNWAISVFTTASAVSLQISAALSGYATQSWVSSQGYITNVIASLGYTPVKNERTISTNGPLNGGGDLSDDITLTISEASESTDGYLNKAKFAEFNNKQSALGFTPANITGDNFTGNIDAPSMSLNGTNLESLMIAYAIALG